MNATAVVVVNATMDVPLINHNSIHSNHEAVDHRQNLIMYYQRTIIFLAVPATPGGVVKSQVRRIPIQRTVQPYHECHLHLLRHPFHEAAMRRFYQEHPAATIAIEGDPYH
jgi:CMP-2-keto-3-deoxyoctulosonic acid synthetase